MKYKFKVAPWAVYNARFDGNRVTLTCFFHVINMKQWEFNGLLAIGKLDRVV